MTTLSLQAPQRRPGGRILAIEADRQRARALRDLFGLRANIDLIVVSSVEEATKSIDERLPDLVLTSAFLQPADAEALTAHLRGTPAAAHVQVLIAPGLIEPPAASTKRPRRRFGFRDRSVPPPPTSCNVAAVLEQIDNYLEQARLAIEHSGATVVEARKGEPDTGRPHMRLVHARQQDNADPLSDLLTRVDQLAGPKGRDRRRATRRPGRDLPWLWTAKLPSGMDLKVVDVSNGGVLVETGTKLPLGSTIDLHILGHETNLSVLARITRAEVAHVDARGVKYHMGAAFARDLDLVRPERPAEPVPGALADVLSRVLAQTHHGTTAALVSFEQELGRLLPVRSVQVREKPAPSPNGTESVYFSVPGAAGSILQATFDRDHAVSPLEFKLLKAAANLAAIVLEFAPSHAEAHGRAAAR